MLTPAGREGRSSPLGQAAVVMLLAGIGVVLRLVWHVPVVPLAAAALAGAVALTSVRTAILALAFLAPFDGYIRPAVIYRDFLAADVAGLAIIAGQWRRGAGLPPSGVYPIVLAVLAVLAALHVLSLGPGNWQQALDNVARFVYFVLLLAAVGTAAREVPLRAAGAALAAGMVLRFLFEARAYFSSPDFVLHPSFQFGAMTSNPNSLAGFGAAVLPLACLFLLAPAGRVARVIAAAAAAVLAGGIFLSYSKGAWLSAAAALSLWTVYLLVRGRLPGRRLVLAAAAVAVLGATIPQVRCVPSLAIERWTSTGSAISNQERLRYVETAFLLVREHPGMGVGLERFGPAYRAERRAERGPDDPHNAYLMVASELGVPALGCYLAFLGIVAVTGFRQARRARAEEVPLRTSLWAAVAALVVFQLFSAEPLASRVLWVVAALALVPPVEVPRAA